MCARCPEFHAGCKWTPSEEWFAEIGEHCPGAPLNARDPTRDLLRESLLVGFQVLGNRAPIEDLVAEGFLPLWLHELYESKEIYPKIVKIFREYFVNAGDLSYALANPHKIPILVEFYHKMQQGRDGDWCRRSADFYEHLLACVQRLDQIEHRAGQSKQGSPPFGGGEGEDRIKAGRGKQGSNPRDAEAGTSGDLSTPQVLKGFPAGSACITVRGSPR
jgi:hypothetical protein